MLLGKLQQHRPIQRRATERPNVLRHWIGNLGAGTVDQQIHFWRDGRLNVLGHRL